MKEEKCGLGKRIEEKCIDDLMNESVWQNAEKMEIDEQFAEAESDSEYDNNYDVELNHLIRNLGLPKDGGEYLEFCET
ncbi:hypothetical protein FQA39_LY04460 [Lamprigera yunnana]|nr:hypothetical protein FQA39_LY04460 [Lamprigera yunnana]